MDHSVGLLSKISTVKEDAILSEEAEQYGRHFVDCVNENIFDNEEAIFHSDSHTVETVNHSSFSYCDQSDEQRMCKSLVRNDAVPVVMGDFEQSVDKADDCTDVAVDCDDEPDVAEKRILIDSVFFACDPASTGAVAVSDVITYLRDTLHVSNYLYTGEKYYTYCLLI